METKFYAFTLTAVYNLVNNDFDSVFASYSSEEIYLDLFDEVKAFIAHSAKQKRPFGVILGLRAMEVLKTSEFIRADLDRQFAELEEGEDDLYGGMSLDCALCDGLRCFRHSADVSSLNAGGYGDLWDCPRGYLKGSLTLTKQDLAEVDNCSGY